MHACVCVTASCRGFYWRKLWKRKWVVLHGDEISYMDEKVNNAVDDIFLSLFLSL